MMRLLPLLLLATLAACTMPQKAAPPRLAEPPPPLDKAVLREALHDRINGLRRAHSLPPLAYDADLQRLARLHSRDMAVHSFFAHENPAGEDVNDRAQSLGLSCTKRLSNDLTAHGFGENLFRTTRYASYRDLYRTQGGESHHVDRTYDWMAPPEIARRVVRGWMESPGHRANLLSRLFEAEGLGIAISGDGLQVYVTQVLC